MLCKKVRQQTNRKTKHQAGQAMMEFVLGLLVVITFFFFYVKMSAVFAIGNYYHYATFMAARAYYSSANSQDAQVQNAETVLQQMIAGRWKALIKPVAGNSATKGANIGPGPLKLEDAHANNWNDGVTFSYKSSLTIYPWSNQGQSVNLNLTSESWLGREESVDECMADKTKIQGNVGVTNVKVEWDNGC
jgi:hypothetical protein